MIAFDGSPYYPTRNIWWHMKHRLFLLWQSVFSFTKHDALSGCVGIQGQKGDRIPECFRFACKWWRGWGDKLLQCDRSVGHDSSPWDWLFLMSTRCLSVFVLNAYDVFGMFLFIIHHYVCIMFFNILELLCLLCVYWAYKLVLSFGDVMDFYCLSCCLHYIDDMVL